MNREKGKREAKPFNKGEEPLSPAARLQPGGMAPLGGGGLREGPAGGQTPVCQYRLFDLPLVPC